MTLPTGSADNKYNGLYLHFFYYSFKNAPIVPVLFIAVYHEMGRDADRMGKNGQL